jgi:hypothetical protein
MACNDRARPPEYSDDSADRDRLSMDAFAVSLSAGASSAMGGRAAFRLRFHFGLFSSMLVLGSWV